MRKLVLISLVLVSFVGFIGCSKSSEKASTADSTGVGGRTVRYITAVIDRYVTTVVDDTKVITAVIDHTKVNEDLTNFPVLLHLSSKSGVNKFDASEMLEEVMNVDASKLNDDFTGSDNETPDINRWSTNAKIQSGKVLLRAHQSDQSQAIVSKHALTGDFDVQIDYEFPGGVIPQGNWQYALTVSSSAIQYRMGRTSSDGYTAATFNRKISATYSASTYSMVSESYKIDRTSRTSDISGSFRIVRTGSTINEYYKKNDDWTLLQTWNNCETGPLYSDIFVNVGSGNNNSLEIFYDNYKVNSGSAIYRNPKKISIITADGTQCYTEIESWNSKENGGVWLWVKVPHISASKNTQLKINYGKNMPENSDYIGNAGETAAQKVWDDNYDVDVWHMTQRPTGAASTIDSTKYANNGTPKRFNDSSFTNGIKASALLLNGNDHWTEIWISFFSSQ